MSERQIQPQWYNHYTWAVKPWLIFPCEVHREHVRVNTSGQEAVRGEQELRWRADLGFSLRRLEQRKLLVGAAGLQRDLQRREGTLHLSVHCRRRDAGLSKITWHATAASTLADTHGSRRTRPGSPTWWSPRWRPPRWPIPALRRKDLPPPRCSPSGQWPCESFLSEHQTLRVTHLDNRFYVEMWRNTIKMKNLLRRFPKKTSLHASDRCYLWLRQTKLILAPIVITWLEIKLLFLN